MIRHIAFRVAAYSAAFFAATLISGCASVTPADYRNEAPVLDLATFFNGKVDASGMFQDRNGKIIKRFTVEMDCRWNGNIGVLDEKFQYSDGTTERRIWTINKNGNRYVGTAADVVGEAAGESGGNALRWTYVLALKVGDSTYNMDMDDWMYLLDERTMLNKTAMSKFGVKAGEVTLFFKKR